MWEIIYLRRGAGEVGKIAFFFHLSRLRGEVARPQQANQRETEFQPLS